MKYKVEIVLLFLAIVLYIAGSFCYSHEVTSQDYPPVSDYPYREYAIPLVIIASILVVTAAVSYSKRK